MKSDGGAAVTVSWIVVLCVIAPEVLVTVMVEVPTAADAPTVIKRFELAELPAAGVTAAGENDAVTPTGRPDTDRFAAELKPYRLDTLVTVLPLEACRTLRFEDPVLTLKSCPGVTVSSRNVLCVIAPEVLVRGIVEVPSTADAPAVSTRFEDAEPSAGGVIEAGENDAVTPAGKPDTARFAAELKPYWLVTVVVALPLEACCTLIYSGVALRVKSGPGLIIRSKVVLCVIAPEVLVTVMVEAPTAVEEPTVSTRFEVAEPFAAGVTEAGENDAVTPAGKPDTDRFAAELKPYWLVTVVAALPLAPCCTLTFNGAVLTLKSRPGVTINSNVVL